MKQIAAALVLVWVLLSGAALYAMDSQKSDQLKKDISALEEEINFWEKAAADESIVFLMTLGGVAPHMSRDQYGAWLEERQIQNGWTDQQVADHQVATSNFSREYRKKLLTDLIPLLERDLYDLRSKLQPPAEPSNDKWDSPVMPFDLFVADNLIGGDWILSIDGKDSIIYVQLDEQRKVLVGTLSVNHLEYHHQGEVIFEVTPVKDLPNRFQGTEFSYDDQGIKVQIPLSLEVKDDILLYRSRDQALQLVRR
ncbi:MAG: hypothetical protein KQI81_22925 [Deltaproteobacteria bacterium]|nr:hypothetical protein [Deltaproteobacteria bacterium]